MNRFDNIDCMIGMKEYPDKYFDLAIVDPPYGIKAGMGVGTTRGMPSKYEKKDWDSYPPSKEYFDELERVSKHQIIWGGNYFANMLKPSRCWIYWRKTMGGNYADGELAWTSYDEVLKEFEKRSEQGDMRIHPTQKPIQLYKWLLTRYAKPNDKILDTHVGSASSLIACEDLGFEYVGFELDEDYYKAANKRLEQFRAQIKLAI